MTPFEVLAALALIAIVLAGVLIGRGGEPVPHRWVLPAGLGAALMAWSVYAIVRDGPVGFWTLHTADAWGNQVWFDLLLSFGLVWYFMQPRLRAVGLTPWPWLLLLLATGSIGLLALLARVLYLEQGIRRRPVESPSPFSRA